MSSVLNIVLKIEQYRHLKIELGNSVLLTRINYHRPHICRMFFIDRCKRFIILEDRLYSNGYIPYTYEKHIIRCELT